MPKNVKRKQGREHLPEPPQVRARTEVDNHTSFQRVVGTRFEADKAQILSKLSEMKQLTTELSDTKIPTEILSTLTGLVYDMREMKRLYTEPPEIKIPPLNIQEEIMKRLPVESLVRFRCVSRSWKSLIDSSKFIAAHKNQPKHLLVQYQEREVGDPSYVSFVDDDSFPRLRDFPALPPFINKLRIVGSSYGLLCLQYYCSDMAVIWNPSIRKSIAIDEPNGLYEGCDIVVGFGVCPVTIDPKIVHITHRCHPQARRRDTGCYKKFGKFWKVNVYKLSSGKFSNLFSNLPSVSIRIKSFSTQVVIDRLIYWLAEEDGTTTHGLIMSFDITDEKFKAVDLPNSLSSLDPNCLSVSKLRESLVILEHNKKRYCYHVWKMDHSGWFTKLFTIKAPCGWILERVEGFRNTGEPIMSVEGSTSYSSPLVYEPNSKKHSNLLLSSPGGYCVESYMETLLLIGCSDCISTSF